MGEDWQPPALPAGDTDVPWGSPCRQVPGPWQKAGWDQGQPAQSHRLLPAPCSDAQEISRALALQLWALGSRLCLAHAVLPV